MRPAAGPGQSGLWSQTGSCSVFLPACSVALSVPSDAVYDVLPSPAYAVPHWLSTQEKQEVSNTIKRLSLSNQIWIKTKGRPADCVCLSSWLVSLTVWLVVSTTEEESCSLSWSVCSRCSAACRLEWATAACCCACFRVAEEPSGRWWSIHFKLSNFINKWIHTLINTSLPHH